MRSRLTLQTQTRVDDGHGGNQGGWQNTVTVWGRIEALGAREREAAQAAQSEVTHLITIRHRAGVTAAMRIVKGARIFNIRGVVDPDERHRRLELTVEEGVAT